MLIKNAPLSLARNTFKKGSSQQSLYARPKFQIPFNEMDVNDGFQIDLDSPECDMTYNLIRQRCFRASLCKDGKVFVSRKARNLVVVHRTA